MDGDMASLSNDARAICLCILAVDGLNGFAWAAEALTSARSPEKGHISDTSADHLTCAKLVDATWKLVLPTLSRLLTYTHSEVLTLQLLKVRIPIFSCL